MNAKSEEHSNVVVVSLDADEFEKFIAPNLRSKTWDFELDRVDPELGTPAIIERLKENQAQVLISGWETPKLPEDMLTQVPSFRYVSHVCGALGWFFPRALLEQGVLVTNWGSTISHTIAEHCVLQVLSALRHATHWQFRLHGGHGYRDPEHTLCSLFDRPVGIHGFGAIAREFSKLIKPWDCKVSAYSPSVPDEVFQEYGVKRAVSLEDLFGKNDVIVELAPLTPAYTGIVTEELLRMIPDGGAFVNSGRGKVVDEEALVRVAKEGRIQFAMDVFANEPLPDDSPLCGLDNVFLTPHIAGPTPDQLYRCGLQALENVTAFFSGGQLQNEVTIKQYDRMT